MDQLRTGIQDNEGERKAPIHRYEGGLDAFVFDRGQWT